MDLPFKSRRIIYIKQKAGKCVSDQSEVFTDWIHILWILLNCRILLSKKKHAYKENQIFLKFFYSFINKKPHRKCNKLLQIYCIFLFIFYLLKLPPTLASAAYSHGSVAKQWPHNCEAPGSKPCRCAILVPFCGALILITVIYDLRA